MTKLIWDAPGDLRYGAGVDRGVFYPANGVGVPWSGLTTVKESLDSTVQTTMYVDGQKQVNQLGLGTFAATIEALTYPDEFLPYDGYSEPAFSGQNRPTFNFAYRTLNANDVYDLDYGYKIHLVYNCLAAPSPRSDNSLNTTSDISAFSWNLATTPVAIQSARASSHFILDSTTILPSVLAAVENQLYGTDTTDPLFFSVPDLLSLFEANAVYTVIDNGDGSWTATGPEEAFNISDDGQFTLNWPWVDTIDEDTYMIKSY